MSSACGLNSHVRKSTLLSVPQALSLHFIRILPSALTASFGAELCQYPFFGSLRTPKYAPTSQSALNCKKAARKSGFPFACARLLLFPTKCPRCAVVLCGDPDRRGTFVFCIQISRSDLRVLIRSFFEYDVPIFEDGLTKTSSVTSLDTTLSHSEWSRSPSAHRALALLSAAATVGGAVKAPSSDALVPERRRCPLKPWGPSGGNGFWGNPQEGA